MDPLGVAIVLAYVPGYVFCITLCVSCIIYTSEEQVTALPYRRIHRHLVQIIESIMAPTVLWCDSPAAARKLMVKGLGFGT